jgi:hypothetical protein
MSVAFSRAPLRVTKAFYEGGVCRMASFEKCVRQGQQKASVRSALAAR